MKSEATNMANTNYIYAVIYIPDFKLFYEVLVSLLFYLFFPFLGFYFYFIFNYLSYPTNMVTEPI